MTPFVKNFLIAAIIIWISLYAYSQFGPPIRFNISSIITQKNDLFTVVGEGKVTAVPDQAQITLGMTTTKPTVESAQNDVNTKSQDLLSALGKLGIEKKDIKTQNYSVNPEYNQNNQVSGYTVNSNFVITIRNLSQLTSVVDTTIKSGLNQVGGISFSLSDAKNKDVSRQARDMAVAEAKDKAQSIAQSTGIRLGKLINATETSNNRPIPLLMKAQTADSGGGQPTNQTTPLEPGSTEIDIFMTLSWDTY